MKKLFLVLLFVPLVSFGQDKGTGEWSGVNINSSLLRVGERTTYHYIAENDNMDKNYSSYTDYVRYGNLNAMSKTIKFKLISRHYDMVKGYVEGPGFLAYEETFKGVYRYNHTGAYGLAQDDEVVKNGKYFNYIPDGWKRVYRASDDICFEVFTICNHVVEVTIPYDCYASHVIKNNLNHSQSTRNFEEGVIEQYDLEVMVNVFLDDLINNNIERGNPVDLISSFGGVARDYEKRPKIRATFEKLEGKAIALSYGINNDENILLKVDPVNWAKASTPKRWYTLYHELGHDVLNFNHGQGGKMMFNYSDVEYDWDTFNKDRNYMFKAYLGK